MKEDENPVDDSSQPSDSGAVPISHSEELNLSIRVSLGKFFNGQGLAEMVRGRGFFPGLIELPKDRTHWSVAIILILLAYLLSFYARLEWIEFAQATYVDANGDTQLIRPQMVKDGVAVANTHDSFYFGSILQKAHLGLHQNNNLLPSAIFSGAITALPYALLKLFPSLTIEQLLLWLPVWVAGFVCIPIVLIGRLYGSTLWGFFAACLAGVTHSYYNRTLAGYYDTDMFSITVPALAIFFLLAASRRESLKFALAGAVTLYLFRFIYGSGQAITCTMCLAFIGYRFGLSVLEYLIDRQGKSFGRSPSLSFACQTAILLSWVMYAEAWSLGSMIEASPTRFWFGLLLLPVLFVVLRFMETVPQTEINSRSLGKSSAKEQDRLSPSFTVRRSQYLVVFASVALLLVGIYGGVYGKITGKLESYLQGPGKVSSASSVSSNYQLNFRNVKQTIREAGKIPPETVRNRILADTPSCSCARCLPASKRKDATILPTAFFGLFGLGLLILWRWEFCMAVPFLAIAYYCFEGKVGLRFTVHVGNYAALGVTFLLMAVVWFLVRTALSGLPKSSLLTASAWPAKILSMAIVGGFVVFLVRPNLQHARNYNSHVVYPGKTIEALEALNRDAAPDDFVLTWWDYGSGSWFYGGARTFTSPAHQTLDNFLTSEILRSTSQLKAANLCRLKAETYMDLHDDTKAHSSEYTTAVQALFQDGSPDLRFYPGLLADLASPDYIPPTQSRGVYLFFPYEIMRIFPTIIGFSSRNLFMDKQLGEYPGGRVPKAMSILRNARREGNSLVFANGFRLDRRGKLRTKDQKGVAPYGSMSIVGAPGEPAKVVDALEVDGLRIPSNPERSSPQRLLYLPEQRDLIILSADAYRSTLAKRFLLDRFDPEAYSHPSFASAADLKRQSYMTQADWVTSSGSKITLNMRGGYKIEADVGTGLAKLPGLAKPVKFSFHRCMHDVKTGKLMKIPSKIEEGAGYHLIQSNLPAFLGGRTYTVPAGGKSIAQIAEIQGVNLFALAQTSGREDDEMLAEGETIDIPSRGYQVIPAWFFMADEVFKSLLVQGFLMENLDPKLFTPVHLSPWGKVYRVLR
jgi:dolichyl-diphosphooligosaccharide--protein glycosyltransferase/undecaprenyl-diphosphooligosaccharide--protein glycosyltransferase